MGIRYNAKKKSKALKLISQISTYLFEEDCGELEKFTDKEKDALYKAKDALMKAHLRITKS